MADCSCDYCNETETCEYAWQESNCEKAVHDKVAKIKDIQNIIQCYKTILTILENNELEDESFYVYAKSSLQMLESYIK
jgi:hypothetical protein